MPFPKLRRAGACILLLTQLVPGAHALSGISVWAQNDIEAARDAGLEPNVFASLSATAPVTRAEFCAIALNAYENVTEKSVAPSTEQPFTDCTDPDVITAYKLGLVSGRGDGIFDPDAPIQRQDLCVMLVNVLNKAKIQAPAIAGDACVEDFPDVSSLRDYAVDAMITMVDYAIVNGVAATGKATQLAPAGTATREQALIMTNRFCNTFASSYRPAIDGDDVELPTIDQTTNTKPSDIWTGQDFTLPTTDAEKMTLVYGEGGAQYQSAEEAEANMVEIAVKVWKLQSDGSKTTGTSYITVNKNLAPIYTKIFEEIYNGDEKFPIKNVGSYAWRTGEHSQGTAIDINWEENMEATINADGTLTPTCGTHWTPGEDPFSIPDGGDVYNAFTKYGFTWGGNAWRSKRDYMHFSYFGR